MPFCRIRQCMQLWRSKNCPPKPFSLENFVDIINYPQWERFLHRNGISITVTSVIDTNGDVSAVFGDPILLQGIKTNHIWADATFRVCPRELGDLQLLTILGLIDEYVSWPWLRNCYIYYIKLYLRKKPREISDLYLGAGSRVILYSIVK